MKKPIKQKKSSSSSPTLRELQYAVIENITGKKLNPTAARQLIERSAFDQAYRLSLYRNATWRKQRQELNYVYEVTLKLLPPKKAVEIIEKYISAHPSNSYTLADMSSRFPQFLKNSGQAAKIPYLIAMAQFEWDLFCFSQKQKHTRLAQKSISKFLKVSANVEVLEVDWPLFDIWKKGSATKYLKARKLNNTKQAIALTKLTNGMTGELLTDPQAQFLRKYVLSKKSFNLKLLSASEKLSFTELKKKKIL